MRESEAQRHLGGAAMARRRVMTPGERRKLWGMLGGPLGPAWKRTNVGIQLNQSVVLLTPIAVPATLEFIGCTKPSLSGGRIYQ